MSAETRLFVLLFALVLITATIIANAEPVPVPTITKEDAIKFVKNQFKKNIYEPAKKQVMPIITTMTNAFAEGIKNATSTAILKGRDAYVKMEKVKKMEKAKQMEKAENDIDMPYDNLYD